jgi:hypothetical protein
MATVTPQTPKEGKFVKNSVGYTLSLIGWIIQIASGTIAAFSLLFFGPPVLSGSMGFMFGRMMTLGTENYYGMMSGNFSVGFSWFFGSWLILFLLAVVIGATGVGFLGSTNPNKIIAGASLVLISAIISFPMVWGFGVGSAVMIVGAILSFMGVFQFKD